MTTFSGNRMDGKVCIVTGATQGLGAAIARRLAAAGAAGIVITGRNATRGAQVAREIAVVLKPGQYRVIVDQSTVPVKTNS